MAIFIKAKALASSPTLAGRFIGWWGVWGRRGEDGRGPVSRIKKFNLLRGIRSAGFF